MSAHRQPTQLVALAIATVALALLVAVAGPPGPQPAQAKGTPTTFLLSRALGGAFHTAPTCVGFLSAASNLVSGDTNGQVDAFVAKISGSGRPRRVSLPGGRQSSSPTTAVAVSGDCSSIAFVTGDRIYVSKRGKRAQAVGGPGNAADPSYSTGLRNDLVFGATGGVYLAKDSRRPHLVGRGGRNPVYNDIKRQVVAYEKNVGGHTQIAYHDVGKAERVISD